MYGAGLKYTSILKDHYVIGFDGELFANTVDYRGETMDGSLQLKDDTEYSGFDTKIRAGWDFVKQSKRTYPGFSSLQVFTGIGYRYWTRDIKSSAQAMGYEETWESIYMDLGVKIGYAIGKSTELYVSGGVLIPLENNEEIDEFNLDLEPGRSTSAFFNLGMNYKMINAELFYKELDFSKSSVVDGAYQPESECRLWGLRIGFRFKF